MTAYADPETLLATWVHDHLTVKTWADPTLPSNERYLAPIAHIQRAPGTGEVALSLDDVQLDVDVYAAKADHARDTAGAIWSAMVLTLPLTTLPGGIFVKRVSAVPPYWTPDPRVFRRSATYRVILHGFLA
jgi:hypothetical protein